MTARPLSRSSARPPRRIGRLLKAAAGLVVLAGAAVAPATSAQAANVGPLFHIHAGADTVVAPGDQFHYFVAVINVGDEATPDLNHDGLADEPRTLTVDLPAGVTVESAKVNEGDPNSWKCPLPVPAGATLTCTSKTISDPRLNLNRRSILDLTASVEGGASGPLTAALQMQGGGAPPASTAVSIDVTPTPLGFGVQAFDNQVLNAAGAPSTEAAEIPAAITTYIRFNTLNNSAPLKGELWPVEPTKDIRVDLPPGLIGNPGASGVAKCSLAELSNGVGIEPLPLCPVASQVGTTTIFSAEGIVIGDSLPVFNMVPPVGVPARFGFILAGTVVALDATVRSGSDYGISVNVDNIPEALALAGSELTFWGEPADPSHDLERSCPGTHAVWEAGPLAAEAACTQLAEEIGLPVYERPPPAAFLRNPTSCTAPGGITTTLTTDSWFDPGATRPDGSPDLSDSAWKQASTVSHEAPGYPHPEEEDGVREMGTHTGIEGCGEVPFEPTISARPTTDEADSPTGLDVDLTVPQNALDEPASAAQADLREAVVKLPAGMSVNPAQANGLGACTSAQIDLHGENTVPTCPDSSKIGHVEITTPLLDHPIEGGVYLAAQNDNPFHSLLALYLVANDKVQSGTVIKLAGEVKANPQTGQLETVFTNQPQLPFEALHLELFGGPRAALINPPSCGTYSTAASLTPWSGSPASNLTSKFTLTSGPSGSPCPPKPAPFAPKLSAGSASLLAGAYSPFSLRLTREDASQRFTGLSVTLPPGLIGRLAGIPYCPEAVLGSIPTAEGTAAAQIASPACPSASQVGTVTVGAGAGPNPFYVQTGKAYLAGPYKGAPLSMAILTPALAGPFDLGNVVVRAALRVDQSTTQITAVSDPIPTILDGIPLNLRDLRVNVNRPGFTLNPTSCDEMSVAGTATGSQGASAPLSDRFQVGECKRLPFAPKLSLSLEGKVNRTANPSLHATLTAKPGEANIARAQVKLPKAAFLDNSHIGTICTRPDFAAHSCPKGSVYGRAKAITPLLDRPLEGNVYLRANPAHKLPDLVADLDGQIEVALAGKTDSVKGALRNTFEAVPDAPVSKFSLTLYGGKRGLIEMSGGFCKAPRAEVRLDAQNGKTHDTEPVVASSCGKAHKHRRRSH